MNNDFASSSWWHQFLGSSRIALQGPELHI
jgi:hypothetical protein